MKTILTVGTFFIVVFLSSQPTINESSGPQIGSQWTEYSTDETEDLIIGSPGADQTWNYTGFIEPFMTTTIEFLDPNDLPTEFDGLFPDAEMATYQETSAVFFISQPDGLYIDGAASIVDSNPDIDYNPTLLFFPYDITYLDTRTNESAFELVFGEDDEFLLRSMVSKEISADGYGSITTPGGTFSDVLRLRMITTSLDSVFQDSDGDGIYEFINTDGTSSNVSYHHLRNAEPFIVASIALNDAETEVYNFTYYDNGISGISDVRELESIIVYPNPSKGIITIDARQMEDISSLVLYDLQGSELFHQERITETSRIELNLSDFRNGIYTLVLKGDNQIWTKKIEIQ